MPAPLAFPVFVENGVSHAIRNPGHHLAGERHGAEYEGPARLANPDFPTGAIWAAILHIPKITNRRKNCRIPWEKDVIRSAFWTIQMFPNEPVGHLCCKIAMQTAVREFPVRVFLLLWIQRQHKANFLAEQGRRLVAGWAFCIGADKLLGKFDMLPAIKAAALPVFR
jgi:hypothetical protein